MTRAFSMAALALAVVCAGLASGCVESAEKQLARDLPKDVTFDTVPGNASMPRMSALASASGNLTLTETHSDTLVTETDVR